MRDQYQVRSEVFEGPLDLLLKLICKNDVDILKISIHKITSEYLEYLTHMESFNLNATSDFLVMAAILIKTKISKLILGHKSGLLEEEVEDKRTGPCRILLEYKEYKEVANFLNERFISQEKVYTRPPRLEAGLIEISLFNLISAYADLLDKRGDLVEEISHDETSITQRMEELLACFGTINTLGFEQLLFKDRTRGGVIITLLAILELVRLRRFRVEQNGPFSEILIYRN